MRLPSLRWLVFGVVGIFVVASLFTGVAVIRPGERAVVRRFGRVLPDRPEPGLWFGLPWGFDRVDRVAIHRVRSVEAGYPRDSEALDPNETPPGQLLTGDHNLVNVRVLVDYAVAQDQIVEYVVNAEQTDELVSRASEAVLASWLAGQPIDTVLVTGKEAVPRVLRAEVPRFLADYRLGIEIRSVTVDLLSPPEEVKAAFDEVTSAQAGIRTRENAAKQAAAKTLNEAQAARYQLEQRTAASVRQLLVAAAAEADRFELRRREYDRHGDEKVAYRAALWWDALGVLFARLKADGRIDLLDNRLAGDGLDVTMMPTRSSSK